MEVGAENTEYSSVHKGGCKEEIELTLKPSLNSELVVLEDDHASSGRETWSRHLEFVLASVGYAVGLGNVWRFPYLCYRSGGGAFLLPYLIMLFLCGIPLLFMEFAVGQYTHLGPVQALAKICPLLKGVGLATVVISYVMSSYYNVLMTWTLYYLFNTFGSTLPWQSCNNTWNVLANCSTGFPGNSTHLQSASQQFFDRRLLEMTTGIEDLGSLRWELFGLLILAWAIVYICIFKGVKSTGKVVYFTAIFPYFILFALLINNMQLPGAKDGILYFLTPVWGKLLEVQVWVNAAAQIFNSLGISFGTMISMASYNKLSNNILRDTWIIALANSATSLFAGLVIFSAIGYMAHIHNLPVDNIATDGPGLVFVVYPEVLSTMPLAQVWSALFFLMLLFLGLDSQFAMVEVTVTSIMDGFGPKALRVLKRKEFVVLVVCGVGFLLGIPHITQMYGAFPLRDTWIIALANSATSLFAGLVIFSAIGYMAHIHNLPVDNIATDGPGLVFVVYPEVLSTMPLAQVWSALFFLMLLFLGLDSQFAMVEVTVTSIMDGFGPKALRVLKRKEFVVLVVCGVGFLLGIPHITQGGIYVFQLMDHYTAVVSLMFLAFFEVLATCWLFGVGRLSCLVERMLGKPPNIFFRFCWMVASPLLVLCILISSVVQYTPARYGKTYRYPLWAEVLGWFISLVSIVWIPLGALYELYSHKGSLLQRLKVSVIPTLELHMVHHLPEKCQADTPEAVSLFPTPPTGPPHSGPPHSGPCNSVSAPSPSSTQYNLYTGESS